MHIGIFQANVWALVFFVMLDLQNKNESFTIR